MNSGQLQDTLGRFAANPKDAALALEAKRLRYAFMFDPLLAMSTSKVDPLPHQIEAVYGYLLKKPRIRFLLAHDPGAGKTIMAGLLIKELKLRGLVERILVVVPGPLKEQWRWEMEDKFDESFEVVGREYYNERGRARVWSGPQIITSLDFAKRTEVLDSMEGARFDLIIVDEAHKMSAYTTGRTTTKTQRYRLGETLSTMSRHLLFLTATPHKGDPANFRLLLDLLEPGYFSADGMMEDSVNSQDNPLFLRRAKEGMANFDGTPLFVPREVHTPDTKLSQPERALYNTMSKYVQEQYNLALQSTKGHNITFALIILQRRFASSAYALCESLKRRKARLEELERGAEKVAKLSGSGDVAAQMEKVDEMSESERWDEEKKWEVLSLAQNAEELRQEIDILDNLIKKSETVMRKKSETKLTQLKSTLKGLDRTQPDEKVLIFTEAKDTLDYLVSNIESWGYTVNTIHGAMSPGTRKAAETVFRDKTRIMVATEAAGEGINLQFCHLMINYDLPWNPNRLEQRMGRIHRYGQKSSVHVFNLVATDTREGQIMQTLFDKLLEIKDAIGSDKVFDVISDIVPGKSLSQLLLDATVRSRSQTTIMSDLDQILDTDRSRMRNYLKDSLASKYMDQTVLGDDRESVRERQLVPDYTRDLFDDIMKWGGGVVRDRGGGLVSVVPPKDVNPDGPESYPAATFDKRTRMAQPGADLITFGHPLFDSALQWVERRCADAAMTGAVFTDPAGNFDGTIVFCEGTVQDAAGRPAGRQMVACYVDASGAARDVPPGILLDLIPGGDPESTPDVEPVRRAALVEAKKSLAALAKTIQKERSHQAVASQKYGVRSIDNILAGIGSDMEALLAKKAKGGKVDLAIFNKRRDRRRYRQARRELQERIKQDRIIKLDAPLVVGLALVVPGSHKDGMHARQALQAVLKYERKYSREPTDVTGMGYGFDVRSTYNPRDAMGGLGKKPHTRYIISKFGSSDTVAMTRNQWLRACMLGDDCYLYIYKKKLLSGQVLEVQNPAKRLPATKTDAGYDVDVSSVNRA